MKGTSSNPAVVNRHSRAPLRSSKAFVATVVPWTSRATPGGAASTAASTASTGRSGVDGTFPTRVSPERMSMATRSVNVPPESMPTSQSPPPSLFVIAAMVTDCTTASPAPSNGAGLRREGDAVLVTEPAQELGGRRRERDRLLALDGRPRLRLARQQERLRPIGSSGAADVAGEAA